MFGNVAFMERGTVTFWKSCNVKIVVLLLKIVMHACEEIWPMQGVGSKGTNSSELGLGRAIWVSWKQTWDWTRWAFVSLLATITQVNHFYIFI
jgi:hypothetical protein